MTDYKPLINVFVRGGVGGRAPQRGQKTEMP